MSYETIIRCVANMKRAIPDDEAGAETWHCNRCNITKSVGKFAKWAIRASNHICRTCAVVRSKEAYVLRKGSLDRILMARVRKHMHKAGAPRSDTFRLKLSDMQRLVARQGARSIISGISNLDRLTVARWDKTCSLPWSFSNLVILTLAEAREHNRRTLTDYHQAYVNHVGAQLLLPRGRLQPQYPTTGTTRNERTISTEKFA